VQKAELVQRMADMLGQMWVDLLGN